MSSLKVIISGGGTGGHIFPAVAIANAIKAKRPQAEFLFVGAQDKMEMEKVPAAGYKIEGLWISGIQRSLSVQNLLFPFKLISSLSKAKRIIKEFKPDVAVGTGGFASGPTLKAATSLKIPAVIQEQNSFPGITNKWLAKDVKKICVAYDGMEQFFPKDKILFTGNPVRKEMVQLEGKQDKAFQKFGLDKEKPVVLVVGGSLGARSINQALMPQLQQLVDAGIQLIWQTGKFTFQEASDAAKPFADKGVFVSDFIYEMDLAYAAADVVISRAGAIAVSELCLVKKPAILVPFPFAAEDHQTKNAMALVNHSAAIHIADKDAAANLVAETIALVQDKTKQEQLSKNMAELGVPDSADIIADEVIKLAEK